MEDCKRLGQRLHRLIYGKWPAGRILRYRLGTTSSDPFGATFP